MQTVALKPKRAEWTAILVGLLILCVLMLLVPVLCVPLALAAPLLACLLVGRKEETVAWISAAVPVAASLIAGYDPLYAASLGLIGALPLLITRFVPLQKRPGAIGMLMYISAVAFALTVVLAMASNMLGGPLSYSLAQVFVDWVDQAENKQMILRQFAANGLISIPKGYIEQGTLRPLMESAYNRQMLMSLKLTMEMLFAQYLPSLVVKSSLIVGLFISLRLERANGVLLIVEAKTAADKHTRVVAPPSFRLLAMPPNVRRTMFALGVTALLLLTSPGSFANTVGKLCYAVFETTFCLLGAAVMVFAYTKTDPDRRLFAGVMASLIFVLAPFVLMLIGMLDQKFHFRKPQASKPDEE